MPRSPEDNQQLKDARRIEILRAASRVFAKKGFVAAKISDIAREAGLSHGLVYHYFENKDAIFGAILEDKLARSRACIAEDEALPGTSLDRLHASMGYWLERTQAEPEMGLMIAQALLSDSLCPEVRTMMANHAKATFMESVSRIRAGQERGEIGTHAPPEELATTIMCVMRGLALTTLVSPDVAFAPPSVDTVMRLLLPTHTLVSTNAKSAEPEAASKQEPAREDGKAAAPGVISIPRSTTKHAARARALPKKTARKATR